MPTKEEYVAEVSEAKYIRPYFGKDGYAIAKSMTDVRGQCPAGLPIPPGRLWIGYGTNNEEHLETGRRHTERMIEIVEATGFDTFKSGNRILDFGCGAGRMLRHFHAHADSCRIMGCDLSGEHIIWAKQYLSPPFQFFINTTIPHLPFSDGFFNFIYCGSVFTHLDDLADTWLLELRRILATGGRLFITIHDEATVQQIGHTDGRLAEQMRQSPTYAKFKDDYEMLVIDRGVWAQVFYDSKIFAARLNSMGFDVLTIEPKAYGYQTGVVLSTKG